MSAEQLNVYCHTGNCEKGKGKFWNADKKKRPKNPNSS